MWLTIDINLQLAAEEGLAENVTSLNYANAEQDEEQENADVPGVRHAGDEAVVDDTVQRFYRREPGAERRAHDDAEEERGIDLLGDQRQSDGDDRRQQRPDGSVKHEKNLPRMQKAVIPGGRTTAVHT